MTDSTPDTNQVGDNVLALVEEDVYTGDIVKLPDGTAAPIDGPIHGDPVEDLPRASDFFKTAKEISQNQDGGTVACMNYVIMICFIASAKIPNLLKEDNPRAFYKYALSMNKDEDGGPDSEPDEWEYADDLDGFIVGEHEGLETFSDATFLEVQPHKSTTFARKRQVTDVNLQNCVDAHLEGEPTHWLNTIAALMPYIPYEQTHTESHIGDSLDLTKADIKFLVFAFLLSLQLVKPFRSKSKLARSDMSSNLFLAVYFLRDFSIDPGAKDNIADLLTNGLYSDPKSCNMLCIFIKQLPWMYKWHIQAWALIYDTSPTYEALTKAKDSCQLKDVFKKAKLWRGFLEAVLTVVFNAAVKQVSPGGSLEWHSNLTADELLHSGVLQIPLDTSQKCLKETDDDDAAPPLFSMEYWMQCEQCNGWWKLSKPEQNSLSHLRTDCSMHEGRECVPDEVENPLALESTETRKDTKRKRDNILVIQDVAQPPEIGSVDDPYVVSSDDDPYVASSNDDSDDTISPEEDDL